MAGPVVKVGICHGFAVFAWKVVAELVAELVALGYNLIRNELSAIQIAIE